MHRHHATAVGYWRPAELQKQSLSSAYMLGCHLLQAEQALTNVAHHIVTLQQDVAQQRAKLRSAERQQRVEAALASQTPRLLQWQVMQVSKP